MQNQIIASFALLLGVINFYYTFLKSKRALHLVSIYSLAKGFPAEFAVVNGGKMDLLITKVNFSFRNLERRSALFPTQVIEWGESSSRLLGAGKGLYFKIEFPEPFTTAFVETGKSDTSNKDLFLHDAFLDISWVEMNGVLHEKSIHVFEYGFRKNGEAASRQSLVSSLNLTKSSKSIYPPLSAY